MKPTDWLTRARLHYNQQQFDQAITAATNALKAPAYADRARLIIGRSHLERYRQSASASDLADGRAALCDVQAEALPPRERVELVIGLGETLYLHNLYGGAAEIFASALGPETPGDVRDSVLDWWATSLDRLAQLQSPEGRQALYTQVVMRSEEALERDAASPAAAYWLAAGLRGAGNSERAWDAAVAGWVRALLSPQRGPGLRADLDYLVTTAIIPERARTMAETPVDREKAVATLTSEWEGVKGNWK